MLIPSIEKWKDLRLQNLGFTFALHKSFLFTNTPSKDIEQRSKIQCEHSARDSDHIIGHAKIRSGKRNKQYFCVRQNGNLPLHYGCIFITGVSNQIKRISHTRTVATKMQQETSPAISTRLVISRYYFLQTVCLRKNLENLLQLMVYLVPDEHLVDIHQCVGNPKKTSGKQGSLSSISQASGSTKRIPKQIIVLNRLYLLWSLREQMCLFLNNKILVVS